MTHNIEQLKDAIRYLEEQLRTASLEERDQLVSELTEARHKLNSQNLLNE